MDSNSVVLLRYFEIENELEVFVNGNKYMTIEQALNKTIDIVRMFEALGVKNFEKQQYKERWY